MAKSAKVKQAEYTEPEVEELTTTPDEGDDNPTPAEAPETPVEDEPAPESTDDDRFAWEVGKRAPSSKWIDQLTQKVVDHKPVRARGLIAQGEIVTTWVLDRLEADKAKS